MSRPSDLVLLGLLATWIPAQRDPVTLLREEGVDPEGTLNSAALLRAR
jgi:hypothetical protein